MGIRQPLHPSLGLTLSELAERLGCARSSVHELVSAGTITTTETPMGAVVACAELERLGVVVGGLDGATIGLPY